MVVSPTVSIHALRLLQSCLVIFIDTFLFMFKTSYVGEVIGNRHGAGTDPIWLDNVNCAGTESGIEQCYHRPWGSHGCSKSEDVSIRCGESV